MMSANVIPSRILGMSQGTILETLEHNKKKLSMLELKKQTKLANIYFLKALELLKEKEIVKELTKDKETWVILT
ncbi:MAG: hypothetical protein EAX86_03490 [Candidatus Heimdallarchaeota archaeon]|nr:hypothetical protein [Candidatus Heimdallarchaeota archaeon]